MQEGPNKYASDASRIGMAAECNPQLAKVAAEKNRLQEKGPTLPPPFAAASLDEKIDRLRTVGLDLARRVQELELQQGVQDQRLHRIEEAFLNHRHSGAEGVAVIPATSVIGWTSAPRLKKEPSLLD